MRVYSGPSGASVYRRQLLDIMHEGQEVEVRGMMTRELLHVVTEITSPLARIQIVPGRRLNPFLALAESFWLLAGRRDLATLEVYSPRHRQFSDDGETLYGAYGYRIASQIDPAIARLRTPGDRRAVLEIWRVEDLTAETRDPPCNTQVLLKVRQGLLDMVVVNRSNDLHWGLQAVNLIQFSFLHEYLAARLGVEVGIQHRWSDSLHIYTGDHPGSLITRRMLNSMAAPLAPVAHRRLFPRFLNVIDHEEFMALCNKVLAGQPLNAPAFPFLQFASEFLAWGRSGNKGSSMFFNPHSLHPYFEDWIKAAEAYGYGGIK